VQNRIELTIGTYTHGSDPARGIVRAWVAPDGSRAQALGVTAFPDPSWIVRSADGKFVYAVSEAEEGQAAAFAVTDSAEGIVGGGAELQPLDSALPTGGSEPCHATLVADGAYLAIANYSDTHDAGSVAIHPIGADGSLGERAWLESHTGSGPHADRQTGPHAHMVTEDPAGRFLLAADLGTDSIYTYEVDASNGRLSQAARTQFRPGFGPRHFVFHPDGQLAYVVGELGCVVATCAYDAATGELRELMETPLLEDFITGEDLPSSIRVSPDGRFLYTAIRGRNTICVLALGADPAKPELIARVPTEGDWPRDIALSPDGSLLLCANQSSGSVIVFRIDPESGLPTPTGAELAVPAPACLVMS